MKLVQLNCDVCFFEKGEISDENWNKSKRHVCAAGTLLWIIVIKCLLINFCKMTCIGITFWFFAWQSPVLRDPT